MSFVSRWRVPAPAFTTRWRGPEGALDAVAAAGPEAPLSAFVVPPSAQGPKGDPGDDGDDGAPGSPGAPGLDGADGADGADGLSAYQVALANGFVGTEAAWLASLVGPKGEKGDKGDPGDDGAAGSPGANGAPGAPGLDGADGADGASAYELAVANGFVGTEAAWLASLVGPKGDQGDPGDTGPAGPAIAHFIAPCLVAGSVITNAVNGLAQVTAGGVAGRMEMSPFIPSRTITIDRLSIEVTTPVPSAQARVGIYSSTATGVPDALLTGQGSLLDCSTMGAKHSMLASNLTLEAGVEYWLAVQYSSTAAVRALSERALLSLGISETGTTHLTGRRASTTFATGLPDPAPSAPLLSGSMPRVALRLV